MQVPQLSRRTWLAVVTAVLGCAIVLVAVFFSSGGAESDDTSGGLPGTQSINPIPKPTATLSDRSRKQLGAAAGDPFAVSFGDRIQHRVTVRIRSDGEVNLLVKFRDGKNNTTRVAGHFFEISRTIYSRSPVAIAAVQVWTGRTASCEMIIDGAVVSQQSATGQWNVASCLG